MSDMFNCMTYIAGKGITRSHHVMVGHNEDDGGLNFVRHAYVEPRDWPEGTMLPAEPGCASIPQIAHTYGYYWVELKNNKGGLSTSDSFTNDNGVVITSNSMSISAESSDDASIVLDGGIGYSLRRILAERAASARDGARILMELIDKWGYAFSGRGYTIADKDEAFMFQLVRGRHYMGARVPDDAVVVMPNHYDFHTLNDCPEMFYPDDIVTYAIEKGWYVPAREGDHSDFDFARAYQRKDILYHPNNVPRQKHGMRIVLGRDPDLTKEYFPFAVYPDHKLDAADFARLLRTHYEGTSDSTAGFGPGRSPHDDPVYLRVCNGSTLESIIWLFDERPELITVLTAPGRPCETPYLPLHPLLALPESMREPIDPKEMMDTHLDPDGSISCYEKTFCREFRDLDLMYDLVYSDVHAMLHKLLGGMLDDVLSENEEFVTGLRGKDISAARASVLEHDERCIEELLTKLKENSPVFPVKIVSVSDMAASDIPKTVAVTFESETGISERDMLFGIDLTSLASEYSRVQPGSLRKTDDGLFEAVFPTDRFGRNLHTGKQIFWLGGKTSNGSPFAASIVLEVR